MIEGLKCIIPGTEVAELARAEAKKLRDRAEKLAAVKVVDSQLGDDELAEKGSNVNKVRQDVEDRIKSLRTRAAELDFIATHIKTTEEYELSQSDLKVLGALSQVLY